MLKKISIIICLVVIILSANAQIKAGERLVYAGSYEISGLMTNIAQVTMSTQSVNTTKNNYLHLSLEMATFNKWDSYFKIRDLYESFVNPTSLKPAMYKRNIQEGGYTKTEKYSFQPDNKTVKSISKRGKRAEQANTFTIGSATVDVVTLIYKLRATNFASFKAGQTANFKLVFDEKEVTVSIRFIGKETIQAGSLGKKPCYKLAVIAGTNKLKGADKNLIWLTADAAKVPALIKFSIPVGLGQLSLTSASGI